MWPGRLKASGPGLRSMRARMVDARSAAEMPVVVPVLASTETVKAVRWLSVLSATISGMRSSSRRAPTTGRQITPLVWRTMKAIPSGVILSAAMIRSPSFSRSASSTTTTNSPRAMAATASSIGANGIGSALSRHQTFDVLGHEIDLEVDRVTRTLDAEGGHGSGVGDHGELEGLVAHGGHREADAVDGDRPLLHHVAEDRLVGGGDGDTGRPVGQRLLLENLADAVDVALDDVAAEAVGQPDGPFEVDPVAGAQGSEGGAAQRLLHGVGRPPAVAELHGGEAAAVDGDRGAEDGVVEDGDGGDLEARPRGVGLDRPDRAQLLDDAGEHWDSDSLGGGR